MKFVNCNLCDSNDAKVLYRIDGTNIVRCRKCGLVYRNPREEDVENLGRLYSEEYYNRYLVDREKSLSKARALVENLAKYVSGNRIKMLEVGAGLGYTLTTARERKWEVFGTEISPFAIRYAKEKLGLEIFNGTLEEAEFPEGFFDLVIMIHTLEHITNPYQYLEIVFRILKKSGLAYIVVPNIASFQSWRQREKWFYLDPGVHLYHFSPHTLKKMALKAGFKVIDIKTSQNIITAEDLSGANIKPLSFLGEKLKDIKRHFPFPLDAFRDFIGKFFPGMGITLVAKK